MFWDGNGRPLCATFWPCKRRPCSAAGDSRSCSRRRTTVASRVGRSPRMTTMAMVTLISRRPHSSPTARNVLFPRSASSAVAAYEKGGRGGWSGEGEREDKVRPIHRRPCMQVVTQRMTEKLRRETRLPQSTKHDKRQFGEGDDGATPEDPQGIGYMMVHER